MTIRPITLHDANAFVALHHRHNVPVTGHRWSVACYDGDRLCGVAICGRPVSRNLDDGFTVEALRVCTDGTKNACSFLYGACARIAKQFGYFRIVTYILETETGTSLKASGWCKSDESAGGGSWDRTGRRREQSQLTLFGEQKKYPQCKKIRYEKKLTEKGAKHEA